MTGSMVCLGMPVGVVLGVGGGLRPKQGQQQFRWGRAVVAGGLAGTISGLAFSGFLWFFGPLTVFPMLGLGVLLPILLG